MVECWKMFIVHPWNEHPRNAAEILLVYGRLATELRGKRFTWDPCSRDAQLLFHRSFCSCMCFVITEAKIKSVFTTRTLSFRARGSRFFCHCSRTRTVDTGKLVSKVIFIGNFSRIRSRANRKSQLQSIV